MQFMAHCPKNGKQVDLLEYANKHCEDCLINFVVVGKMMAGNIQKPVVVGNVVTGTMQPLPPNIKIQESKEPRLGEKMPSIRGCEDVYDLGEYIPSLRMPSKGLIESNRHMIDIESKPDSVIIYCPKKSHIYEHDVDYSDKSNFICRGCGETV